LEEVEGRLYRPGLRVQSDDDAVLAGAAGAGVVVVLLEPESEEFDLLDSDDVPDSPDEVVLDDEVEDFDLPPRLSVL
jgi:hypothetical protein